MNLKLTKEQSRQRWSELRKLLNQWDFIGVIDIGGLDDEYDCLIGPLMRRLEQKASVKELSEYLRERLSEHFGMEYVSDTEEFSVKAKKWFETHWPESEV